MLKVILQKNLLMLIPRTTDLRVNRTYSNLLEVNKEGSEPTPEPQTYNEKYLKVSDFLEIINSDRNTKSKKIEDIKEILMTMQDHANFGKIASILLAKISFDQLQDKILQNIQFDYTYEHKKQFVLALIQQSITIERFDITYEMVIRNIQDLSKMSYLSFLDTLIEFFKLDNEMLEVKLAIISMLIPNMSNMQAVTFMKTIETVLDDPPEDCMMRVNLNPLRVSMILYQVIDQI